MMTKRLNDVAFRMKAWRGSISSKGLSSLWYNDLDDYENGSINLVASSLTGDQSEIENLASLLFALFKFDESIAQLVYNYFGIASNSSEKLICIESILVPLSQKYVVLKIYPLTDDLHHGTGVVIDIEKCATSELNVNLDVGFVSDKNIAVIWDADFENWRDFENIEFNPTPINEGSIQSFPLLDKNEVKRVLKSFSKTRGGYEFLWNTELFNSGHVNVRITDDFVGKPKPKEIHAAALAWLKNNKDRVQMETMSKLRTELSFNEDEIAKLELLEIALYEDPLKKITLIFETEKFDYDEHGLGVIWSKGKITYCGHF